MRGGIFVFSLGNEQNRLGKQHNSSKFISDGYGFTIDLNFKMDFENIRTGAAFCTPHFKTLFGNTYLINF